MDLNRNQFFFLGLMVLMLGLQFRAVGSYILTPEATQFLAERSADEISAATVAAQGGAKKVIQPPDWLGWCMISVGWVFILHSLVMKKPGG